MAAKSSRKRATKTSEEQLLEYLRLMEEDVVFRTRTINPTLESDDYIEAKWIKLASTLNSCNSGPELSVNEWKTRFNNYKNTTRAKYRKKKDDMNRTGGGPATEPKLTDLEERLLDVWGRVVLTGSKKVKVAGGLQLYTPEEEVEVDDEIVNPETVIQNAEIVIDDHNDLINVRGLAGDLDGDDSTSQVHDNLLVVNQHDGSGSSLLTKPKMPFGSRKRKHSNSMSEHRSIKVIGEELLAAYKSDTDHALKKMLIDEEKVKIEKAKLQFEIAKYKFENPGFSFECDL